MQIDSLNSNGPAQVLTNAVEDSRTHSGRTHRHHHGGGDQVQLSDLAQKLAASDPSKVHQLQAAVDTGTYRVAPNDIAASIIDSALSGT
jgi:flagellar biosynthesis anti-sigma factor FlgM